MNQKMTRRALFANGSGIALTSGILTGMPTISKGADPTKEEKSSDLWAGFPRQDTKLVAEIVGTAHNNEARVKELVKAHPALVNAWWDWGFGDWESPLGAASHVGRRGIAEFLLAQGARIDIFAAAMLGFTDVVKAFVTAQPGIQRTLGPHGITLLAHAQAGGKKSADTVAYLESLGDAGVGLKVTPLPKDRQAIYFGKFASDQADVRLTCRVNKNGLLTVDIQSGKTASVSRILFCVEGDEFFTSGVPSVRFRFAVENGKAQSVTIRGTDLLLTAKRVAD